MDYKTIPALIRVYSYMNNVLTVTMEFQTRPMEEQWKSYPSSQGVIWKGFRKKVILVDLKER